MTRTSYVMAIVATWTFPNFTAAESMVHFQLDSALIRPDDMWGSKPPVYVIVFDKCPGMKLSVF